MLPFTAGDPGTAYAQPELDFTYLDGARAAGRDRRLHASVQRPRPRSRPVGRRIAHRARHRARHGRLLRHRRARLRRARLGRDCTTASSTAASALPRLRDRQLFRRVARPAARRRPRLRPDPRTSEPPFVDRWHQGAAHVRHDGTAALPRSGREGPRRGDCACRRRSSRAEGQGRGRVDRSTRKARGHRQRTGGGDGSHQTTSQTIAFTGAVPVPQGGWVAARVVGPSSRYVTDSYAFAQTSPVYVVRNGKPFTSAEDAIFLREVVDGIWARIDTQQTRWRTPAEREKFKAAIDQARAVYDAIAKR